MKKNKLKLNRKACMLLAALIVIIVVIAGFASCNKKEDGKIKKADFEYTGNDLDRFILAKNYGDFEFYYRGMESLSIDGKNILDFIEKNSIEDLRNYFNKSETYKDGGSILYTCDDEKVCDPDIKMVFCSTLSGDKSVYAGPMESDLDCTYCINNGVDLAE